MFIKKQNSLVKIICSVMIVFAFLFPNQLTGQLLPGQQVPQTPEYSDQELISFINAAQEVMQLRQESQMKMIEKIEDENLTLEKFNDIIDANNSGEEINATEEEMEAFNNAAEGIQEVQEEYQPVMVKAVENAGLTPVKYDEINNNYQSDPELQERINVLFEEMAEDE